MSRGPGGKRKSQPTLSRVIYISKLPTLSSDDALYDVASQFGQVMKVQRLTYGKAAFVEYHELDSAESFYRFAMNEGVRVLNKLVNVEYSTKQSLARRDTRPRRGVDKGIENKRSVFLPDGKQPYVDDVRNIGRSHIPALAPPPPITSSDTAREVMLPVLIYDDGEMQINTLSRRWPKDIKLPMQIENDRRMTSDLIPALMDRRRRSPSPERRNRGYINPPDDRRNRGAYGSVRGRSPVQSLRAHPYASNRDLGAGGRLSVRYSPSPTRFDRAPHYDERSPRFDRRSPVVERVPRFESAPQRKVLILNNISKNIGPAELAKLVGCYGDVMRIKFIYKKQESAFVVVRDEEHAQRVIHHLNGQLIFDGPPLSIAFSRHQTLAPFRGGEFEIEIDPDDRCHRYSFRGGQRELRTLTAPTKTLHISNIPAEVDEQEVGDYMNAIAFQFFRSKKGMGYCKFDSIREASASLMAKHGTRFQGSRLRVSFTRSRIFAQGDRGRRDRSRSSEMREVRVKDVEPDFS